MENIIPFLKLLEDGQNWINHKDKMYHWKGGNEIFDPENLQSFIGLKEVKVDYVIKGCCEHENDQCTKLFHYPKNDEKKLSGNLVNEVVEKQAYYSSLKKRVSLHLKF